MAKGPGRARTVRGVLTDLLALNEELAELDARIKTEEARKPDKAWTVSRCLQVCRVDASRIPDLKAALQPLAFPGDPRFASTLGRYYNQTLRMLREGAYPVPVTDESYRRFFLRADYEAVVVETQQYNVRLADVLAVAVDTVAQDPACDGLFGDIADPDAHRAALDDLKKRRGELLARRALVREEAEAMKADVEAALR